MNIFKNAVIALLAGLLVLTLSTQNSSGATSSSAKAIEYDTCLKQELPGWIQLNGTNAVDRSMASAISECAKYKP